MTVYRSLAEIPHNPLSVLTIGTFDGVHRGHQQVIGALTNKARTLGGRSVVITFDPHPQEVIRRHGTTVDILTTIEERQQQFQHIGVDAVVVIPFTREFAATPWEEFVQQLQQHIGIAHMIVGHDHAFGKDRKGNAESLRGYGAEHGFGVTEIGPLLIGDQAISSTKIRRALAEGNLPTATEYLGRNYSLSGTVVRGDGRGRKLGIPTANISPLNPNKLIPANGVYCVRMQVGGVWHRGMGNIGVRPTFTDATQRTIEVNLFEFAEEIYHQIVTVELCKFARSEQKFGSAEEFLEQLQRDRATCQAAV
ncbi:MAG: bifunctional riboflavin kinase/FAD synthetase [Armatimonadetes bacterium]|nr:bifunctional riboflavin kinase/FAD synthetase [Armatimonadota bacterium]